MSKVSAELARIEEMMIRLNRAACDAMIEIDRRMVQHEQALLELAEQQTIVEAAMNGHREAPSPSLEKVSSAKP